MQYFWKRIYSNMSMRHFFFASPLTSLRCFVPIHLSINKSGLILLFSFGHVGMRVVFVVNTTHHHVVCCFAVGIIFFFFVLLFSSHPRSCCCYFQVCFVLLIVLLCIEGWYAYALSAERGWHAYVLLVYIPIKNNGS